MRINYVDKLRLGNTNKLRLQQINNIIEEYQAQGYRLTLRQLYYQLVSRDIIPNKQSEYAKLTTLTDTSNVNISNIDFFMCMFLLVL